MNETQAFTEIVLKGMNNPDCSFFVGNFTGQFMTMNWIITILIIYAILKVVDKLAFTPLIDWIKSKIYKGKK